MGELISTCCSATHDERFHFNEDYNEGICVDCKEHASFEEIKDD